MHRKTVRKLALIHWACFQNEVTRLDGSTLFTGVNGSGKSTILDAVSYLLTANTQFNLAAKDKDRTVRGYVRGDTKSNGKDQYLRTGEVVSYLAMEFDSETDGSRFVIGVCIESPNPTDKCTSNWFILKNTELADVRMAEEKDKILYVYPRKQLTVKGKTLKMSDFLGRDKAKFQILRALGLRCDPEKYRNKLVKMMSFNPENNVDQFIQNCVLEPGNVNSLKELRAQKERFDQLRGIYENLKISKDKLDVVEQKTEDYEKQQRLYHSRMLMLKYQEMLLCKEEQEAIERRQKILRSKQETLLDRVNEVEKMQGAARERYESAISSENYANIKSSIDAINRQIELLEAEEEQNQKDIKKLSGLKDRVIQLRENLGNYLEVDEESAKVLRALGTRSFSAEKSRECILLIIGQLKRLQDMIGEERYRLKREIETIRDRLADVRERISRLEHQILPYPKEQETARKQLQEELRKKHPDVQVRFFAELVQEIRDPAWRSAIETFLGRKRFYLIVDDRYIEEALYVLNERKMHQANLVISDKIPETSTQKGSAAEILVIPNASARRYANYLLNGIHLCDTVEELHEHPKGGLMRDGMLAKSYSAAMMDMRSTRYYLGTDAIELQLQECRRERGAFEKEEEQACAEMELAQKSFQTVQEADFRESDYDFSAADKLEENKERLQKIYAEKEELESNPSFITVLEEVNRAKDEVDRLTREKSKLDTQKGELNSEIAKEEERAKQNAGEIFQKSNQYDEYRIQHLELEREMKEEYEKRRKRSENTNVIKEDTVNKLRTETERAREEMEKAQRAYLQASGMNLEKYGVSYIHYFRKEKREISNVRIEEASNKLEANAKEMETTFMTDFVAELNESMLLALGEVDKINTELRHLPFGNDTYHFVMEEREDRGDFFRICRKLNHFGSVEMLQSMNADDEELSHDIRSFMDKILSEQDESEFTDYRKYFKYDMKIRTRRGGEEIESDFSKKQGSASNGEKQTPYFIILAASLIQCYPRDVECARLAFIDEAFAALSRERIEQMVKYLEDNHFQVLYAAPPEKISSIGDLIGTTVSLVSTGKYTKLIEGLVKP